MIQVRTISRKDLDRGIIMKKVPVNIGHYLAGFADGEDDILKKFRGSSETIRQIRRKTLAE